MALGKYSRIDNRRSSSSYCSTVTIVVFVALCLVGVWMMTSSSVGPVQNVDVQQENKDDVKQPVIENTGSNAQQFEDNPGDLPEDARKGDSSEDSSNQDGSNSSEQNNTEENQEGKPEGKTEEKPEETSEEKNKEETGRDEEPKPEEGSNSETEAESKTNTDETKDEKGESNSESGESKTESEESESGGQNESENSSEEKKADASEEEEKSEESEKKSLNSDEEKDNSQIDEKVEQNNDSKSDETTVDNNENSQNQTSTEVFPSGAQSELSTENSSQSGAWSTQASESKNEKEAQKSSKQQTEYNWKICNVTAGTDYIPCLDNLLAIKSLPSTKHYEHRERHCPEEPPTCLVPLPEGYKRSIAWPKSRDKIWYYNVPHTKLAEVKGHQNWVKVSGEFLTFPGGGTQFKHGALHYIDFIQESVPDVAWGKQTRVILDVGCGVASFGGYLFERDVLAMSFAPKDEHEAQVQFALERGIPAVSAVMGTTRLPYPGRVFDAVHCARCRVPWHIEGGKLLLELNRVLRPGGFFVWSATPVYQKLPEDVEIWNAMGELTKAMCWELISINKDTVNGVGVALYKKPTNNECYEKRQKQEPLICPDSDDINAAWNVPLQACMHKIPVGASERGSQWPEQWPLRLEKPPYWLLSSRVGVYGKAAPEDFTSDYEHWKHVVINSYVNGMGVDWKSFRNVMDMRSIYGGFAAALKNLNVWVMNVVSIDAPDTLPIIYDRGLFGIYHDWCESFSTYPRSYDLLHADHLFSKVKKSRCNLVAVVAECDRILRPEGKLIIRDDAETISELENMAKSMKWEIRFSSLKDNEGLLYVQKSIWRPTESETLKYAIL